ncbi:hypothetical protein NEICINOT_03423 [Neisseria cinerea ATCC 14685]|uniref:Uncharacterized protein n=1 Tax=Neisseria cinerea ATCC 14685 TaxID=546262 RepID=D0W1A3_NEICI|nr:hypothetical protein NEICINOT_03423 [Neisseria cinerea ATCC 14685]
MPSEPLSDGIVQLPQVHPGKPKQIPLQSHFQAKITTKQITGKNMNTDFQNILKQLGKQAKKEAAEKQEAEKTSKNKNRIWISHKQSDKSPH